MTAIRLFRLFQSLKEHKIRCSVVGLSAEVKVCKRLTTTTQGTAFLLKEYLGFICIQCWSSLRSILCKKGTLLNFGYDLNLTLSVASSLVRCEDESRLLWNLYCVPFKKRLLKGSVLSFVKTFMRQNQ